jgi:tetratricopeptide (TPR) repeat protein
VPTIRRVAFYGWSLCASVFLSGAWLVSQKPFPTFPLFERPAMEVFAAQDMGMVLNGARRLGADLAFIQLMQYYGTPENADPNHPRGRRRKAGPPAHDEHEDHVHLHLGSEGNADATDRTSRSFPQILEYTIRAGTLDPRFHFLYLFSAGALAFNLNRADDAMAVLEHGARGDPGFWRYRLYQGAIAFRKNQEIDKAIANLEEALRDPECPSMIKNILGNIYIKQGHFQRAKEIYLDLLNSRDQSYSVFAEQQLRKLP